jgi:hypothetical protein
MSKFQEALNAANSMLSAEDQAKLKEPVTREELLGFIALVTSPYSYFQHPYEAIKRSGKPLLDRWLEED